MTRRFMSPRARASLEKGPEIMPFAHYLGTPFIRDELLELASNMRGVYGLRRISDAAWVYVGKGDIRARLLDHLNGDNPCITQERPTHFFAERTNSANARERELILELDPICNRRMG